MVIGVQVFYYYCVIRLELQVKYSYEVSGGIQLLLEAARNVIHAMIQCIKSKYVRRRGILYNSRLSV